MKVIRLTYPIHKNEVQLPPSKHVMAIGYFDGLHKGHQNVVKHAIEIGKQQGIPVSIMTFDPHPREVLGHSKYSRYLTPFSMKMDLFEEIGVDYTFVVNFSEDFAKVSPEHFVEYMLFQLQLHSIVVGFDFTFGHHGMGTVETLRELLMDKIHLQIVKPFNIDGYKVSSTYIREQLHLGRLEQACHFLGRSYTIAGYVIEGEQRGRTIGFPTANIQVKEPYVIPRQGVYAVNVRHKGQVYNGVMNIGVKPTFLIDLENPTIEVHILNFDQQIYGQSLKIELLAFLRDEEKFPSIEVLIQQIKEDIKQAEQIFKVN